MGVTNFNKEVTTPQIPCGGEFNVRLSLTAEPDITSNPTDIVLLLDRSGSMVGAPLTNMKNGAKAFIDIIEQATDGVVDGNIGGGSRMAVVSFSDTATSDTTLITSVSDLKSAVDALVSNGSTNHEDAFTKALEVINDGSTNAKIIVMFTDGMTTAGGDANTVATLAKSQGVIIYLIGLSGNGGIDINALESWASSPASSYVAITPDNEELEELFEGIAENIVKPGATNIVITDTILPCFNVISISSPTKGSATLINSQTVQWEIDELGVNASEGATFEFTVRHTGTCSGLSEVNQEITYTDNEGNVVSFPSPQIDIDCDIIVIPEECPVARDFTVQGCSENIIFDAGEVEILSLGRIVEVSVVVKNVCPGKRVALGIILNEIDANGEEQKRGFKTLTLPAHDRAECRDVLVKCVKFVLPEDLTENTSTCAQRNFNAKIICNYIDNNFECCPLDE